MLDPSQRIGHSIGDDHENRTLKEIKEETK
jgi:hypothetical protein